MASRDKVADAEECKDKGNECLKAGEFDKAIEWYKQAISLNKSHVYYSNRSAAYLSKGFADSALKDALECIKMKPDWPKGYSRKGAALHKLNKLDEAKAAYEEGLKLDAENKGLLDGLNNVVQQQSAGPAGGNGMDGMFAGMMDKVKADPKLSKYLSDPTYVNMLRTLENDPNSIGQFMQDPRMMETLSAVLGIQMSAAPPDSEARAAQEAKEKEKEKERKKREEEEKARKEKEAYDALSPEEKEKKDNQVKAKEHKTKGNEFYKKKEFESALKEYDTAIALDPTDMTFITNRAAVFLEQGDLEKCLDECKKAIEIGRKNYADYPLIAKAYARMGNACFKHKMYEEALKHYSASQLEHSTVAVASQIKKAEKKLKIEKEKAYLDPEKGKEAKEKGNVLFKEGKFPDAIKEYSEAIKRDPTQSTYYNNRAAAYMKLADFGRAMDDCKKAIELDPKNVKAYGRKGNIEFFLKEYHKAMDTFKAGLELDPENKTCMEGIQKTNYAVRSSAGTQDGQRAARAMEDPEIRNIMSDPIMKQVLEDLRTNPASAQKHLANPEVASKIEKLIAAGIIQTR